VKDETCFIQFIHPGSEHVPRTDGRCDWNPTTKEHGRKFLVSMGTYLSTARSEPERAELMFWGEWEPPSVHNPIPEVKQGFPTSFAHPLLEKRTDFYGLHNTDPFVFGDKFYYTNCKQWRGSGKTQLRHLAEGTVILFGSHKAGKFLLDTVFVVASYRDHSLTDFGSGQLKQLLPPTYFDVTMRPTYSSEENRSLTFRLYEGAAPTSPSNGMFSFFPCLPFSRSGAFSRPPIRIDGLITQSLRIGQRLNRGQSAVQIRNGWQAVVEQVLGHGLALGIRADMPTESQPASFTRPEPTSSAGRRC
jgi:hypothetical protein